MGRLLMAGATALAIAACGLPFGIGHPSTSDLLSGAAGSLAKAKSFEAKTTFLDGPKAYDLDIEYAAPATVHIGGKQGDDDIEMLGYNGKTYYKGRLFLDTLVADPTSQKVLKGSDDRWVTSSQLAPIDVSEITDPGKARLLLTGPASNRQDDVSFNGQNTAELTLPAALVNITESSPYRLVRLRSLPGQTMGGESRLDVAFSNYDKDFAIQAPANVFDFDDPTTWPPMYATHSISQKTIPGTGSCDDPCALSAVLENAGGLNGATMASTVTFKLTNAADHSVLGSCSVTIQPDHPHGQKFTTGCTIQSSAWTNFTGNYDYGADVDNPTYD